MEIGDQEAIKKLMDKLTECPVAHGSPCVKSLDMSCIQCCHTCNVEDCMYECLRSLADRWGKQRR